MTVRFLCQEFTPLEFESRPGLEPFLMRHPHPLVGYTFDVLISWSAVFDYKWSFLSENTLVIACCPGAKEECHLLQPIGLFSGPCEERLIERLRQVPYPVKIYGVTSQFINSHPRFVSYFDVLEDRDNSNYLYGAEDLASLKGRRFQKKRNLVNQARQLYSWQVAPMSVGDVAECRQLVAEVRAESSEEESDPSLNRENRALDFVLEHFEGMKEQGVVIRVDGRLVAFSMYELLAPHPRTAVIHFEKALRAYKGLYQVINQETAAILLASGYEFINREEDLGDLGLRQAKLSYNPVQVLSAYLLTFKA